jgi:hypothetical protein
VVPLRGKKIQFGVVRKKLCYHEYFFNLWVVWPPPKKHQFFFKYLFITLNTSISTRKVMIYSMFMSEVNNMRSFVLRAIMTSLGKSNI